MLNHICREGDISEEDHHPPSERIPEGMCILLILNSLSHTSCHAYCKIVLENVVPEQICSCEDLVAPLVRTWLHYSICLVAGKFKRVLVLLVETRNSKSEKVQVE